MRDFRRAHPLAIHEIQHHARIERPAATAHHQSVENAQSHRGGDATPVAHRAHAGAVAEMRDDNFAVRAGAEVGRKDRGDVFVGQAVKAVALHALPGQRAGQREGRGNVRLAGMKRGIEADDLRDVGVEFPKRADRFQIVRLMQRCERNQKLEIAQHGRRDANRLRIMLAAVHDAMPGGGDIDVLGMRGKPFQQGGKSLVVRCRPTHGPVGQGFLPGVAYEQMQRVADSFDFAVVSGRVLNRYCSGRVQRKLDAR